MKNDIVFQGKMTDQTHAERKVFGHIEGKSVGGIETNGIKNNIIVHRPYIKVGQRSR